MSVCVCCACMNVCVRVSVFACLFMCVCVCSPARGSPAVTESPVVTADEACPDEDPRSADSPASGTAPPLALTCASVLSGS